MNASESKTPNKSAAKVEAKVAVIGGGSFGSALADILGNNGHRVALQFRSTESAAAFNATRINTKYLPGITLSTNITATADLDEAVRGAALVLLCVPSPWFRETVRALAPSLTAEQMLVSTTKGIETGTFKLMTEILAEETPCTRIGALSGPNLAKEIAAHKLSGTVIASSDAGLVAVVQEWLSCSYFRVYGNPDVRGVELGGVLKNVYAIATGLADALDLGDNTRGLILTRALAEMSRFAVQSGADPLTFLGLAGVGDLITTCTSPQSRNFRVGRLIGQGKTLDAAVKEIGEVAEGVHTVRVVYDRLADMGIRMRILEGLHALLFEGRPVREVVGGLMSEPQMEDVEFARK
jgi:glycerol-3-phosphate dehydrogenase (NAD(P)+)